MVQDTLILDKPEQLKALGHPLRVRVLEMLGQEEEWQLTNRELAQRLGVDPGHLHFHVRMLLKAGLIELAHNGGSGREKPYRAVARTFRVAPELLASGGARDIQAAMIDQVQRAHALYAGKGTFRSAQLVLQQWEEARVLADRLRTEDGFPSDVADALAFVAADDPVGYTEAIGAVLESFETRDEYLEDVPVADTVLVLQALARRRGIDVALGSELLP